MSPELFAAGASVARAVASSLGLDLEHLGDHPLFDALTDDSITAGHGPDTVSATHGADGASTRESATVLEKAEPYYGPGRDPVGRPSADGKTAIENAYEGSNPAMDVEKDMSPMMQSARAVADKAGMAVGSPERLAFLNAIQDRTGLTDGVLKDGDRVIMGDGPGGGASKAKLMVIDGGARGVNDAALPVERGTYTWTDAEGNKHSRSFSIIKDCANPALDEKEVIATPKPAAEPPADKVDHCPEDGQMFDGMGKGIYQLAEKVEYVSPGGSVKMVGVSMVIADSPLEAKQLGWKEARATDGYVQMFYRDAEGCLHYAGCYPPDIEDTVRQGGTRIMHAPDPKFGYIWDAESRDKDGNLIFDKNGNGKMDKGDVVLQLKKGPEGTRVIEWEFKRQGFTKFTKIG